MSQGAEDGRPPAAALEAPPGDEVAELVEELTAIRNQALALERRFAAHLHRQHPAYRESTCNFLHYLALRHFDLHRLQRRLARLGLASLERTEPHVLASLEAVLGLLHRLGEDAEAPAGENGIEAGGAAESAAAEIGPGPQPPSFERGAALLGEHTDALLGPPPGAGRQVRVMVTLPSVAADDGALVDRLVEAGMDCARIDCAHGDTEVWRRMAEQVRRAAEEAGRPVKIAMDLAGRKLRTGPLAPGPRAVRLPVTKDVLGQVVRPALAWLGPPGVAPPGGWPEDPGDDYAALPVPGEFSGALEAGDRIRLRDARGRKRRFRVLSQEGEGAWVDSRRTAYLEAGITLVRERPAEGKADVDRASIGELPAAEASIWLRTGETLHLLAERVEGTPAVRDDRDRAATPARISCSPPEVFAETLAAIEEGQRTVFGGGAIEGVVRERRDDRLVIEITRAGLQGSDLRAHHEIAFPDSELPPAGLGERGSTDHEVAALDAAALDVAARYGDLIGLPAVADPAAVVALRRELAARDAEHLGVLLGIATRRGFENLPRLLLVAMRGHPVGVTIARGELAAECGRERIAEVQEEILWLCEAAHLPAVQAVGGAAGPDEESPGAVATVGEGAECVLLDQRSCGAGDLGALVESLRSTVRRRGEKTPMLRSLKVSEILRD